jgi:hypothetical protein
MTRPDTLFEAASYDLNQFIERRKAERRASQRDSCDRRQCPSGQQQQTNPAPSPDNSTPH